MLHYEQVFDNVFERRESKCCEVFMKHSRKVKSEQVITLQIAQQVNTKNINVVQGQLFCRQCKAKFLLETDSPCWWSRSTKEKAPINWHFTCQLTRIHENFKEKYFRTIQITSWLFERYERESEWLGCKRQCKKNWKKHHIQTNPNSYLGTW